MVIGQILLVEISLRPIWDDSLKTVINPISPLSVKSLIFCEKYFNLISEKPFVSRDCERFYFNPTYIL